MFERYRVIHFVGIGGIGMSGIAEVLHNLGYEVRGSDVRASEATERLSCLGIGVALGHRAENVHGAHVVVISSAIGGDNAEVQEARRLAIPVIPRAEMLAELGRLKYAVLVAGTHGKTTTTSLISTVLAHAGFDPTVVIGGKLKAIGTNARLGLGKFMVAEADESDGSFLRLTPTIGVVTNIDREHMEYFKSMDALKEAFLMFMNKVPFYGMSVLCADDANIKAMLPSVHRRYLTYGMSEEADLRAVRLKRGAMRMEFEVLLRGAGLGRFAIPIPGLHNVLNTLACIGVALELQVDADKVREALELFGGIQRRMEFKGEAAGVRVFDDYGHHPTEIAATMEAMRTAVGAGGRLVVVFQPHRYTRTRDLMDDFARVLGGADVLTLLDIYPAAEKPIEGVSSDVLFQKIRGAYKMLINGREGAAAALRPILKAGDVLLTLGAGDVWKVGPEVLKELEGNG